MSFPFTFLPTELALEIVRVAASLPNYEDVIAPRPSYATALSMASVSHAMRSATMPHLLHSVVLASSPQVLSFIDSILLQKQFYTSSALALDYTKLVRRFWSTVCWEALTDDSPDYCINYAALYEVVRGVDSLGLDFRSLHLLYNGLASPGADPARDWQCRRVTFAGSFPRWKPLTSTMEGTAFLSRITHLTLWIPTHTYPWLPPPTQESPVPRWIQDIPFSAFQNLTHLAFPL
ncbi:hypothetical protein DFH09DRAFT_893720, partial [Mycena vulgaris]